MNKSTAVPEFHTRLRDLLATRGMTQTALAGRLGVRPHHVCRWATGRMTPRATTIRKIADILNVTMNDLV